MRSFFLIILLLTLLQIISGCSALERLNKKMPPEAEVPKVVSEQDQQKMLTQLQAEQIKLREQVQTLDQQISTLKKTQEEQLQQLNTMQAQWETNFMLFEESVSESLEKTERQLQQQKVQSLVPTPVTTQTQTAQPSKTQAPPPKVQPRLLQAEQKPLIETYSLFPPAPIQGEDAKKTTVPVPLPPVPTQGEDAKKITVPVPPPPRIQSLTPKTLIPAPALLPLPPPDEDEVVNEQKPSAPAETPQPGPAQDPPGNVAAVPFQDADLEEPQAPLTLKMHPGVKRLYNQGMSALIEKRYESAIQLFNNFTEQFPDDFDSDNATYWIGHSYFKLKRLLEAENAFRKILRLYEHRSTSQGYKTPEAIYMLGKIAAQQQEFEKARYYFQEVNKRFPDSSSAESAKKELQKQ
ncbi:tetratricopeptide repeat protein [Deltaproteobacteria bacterium TL4]